MVRNDKVNLNLSVGEGGVTEESQLGMWLQGGEWFVRLSRVDAGRPVGRFSSSSKEAVCARSRGATALCSPP